MDGIKQYEKLFFVVDARLFSGKPNAVIFDTQFWISLVFQEDMFEIPARQQQGERIKRIFQKYQDKNAHIVILDIIHGNFVKQSFTNLINLPQICWDSLQRPKLR